MFCPIGNPRHACVAGLFALAALVAAAPAAVADPLETAGGTVVLALSGLEVDLPYLTGGGVYHLSGSFSLDEDGNYDGRDVVDEFAGEELVAGTWISVGYFNAGGPAEVVKAVGLSQGWATQTDMWGATWSVAGGVFSFESELGEKPAVVACTQLDSGKALLLHHFFIDQTTTMSQAEMLAQLSQAPAMQAVWNSYRQQRTGAVQPLRRPEIKNRGDKEPARWEDLETSVLELELPDDGYVWLVRAEPDQGVDFLDRMAPALPEISVEVLTVYGGSCQETFDAITAEKRDVQPQNLPFDWNAGPQLVVDGNLELTACYGTESGVAVVGIFQGPTATDVGYLAPLLDAIGEAMDVP